MNVVLPEHAWGLTIGSAEVGRNLPDRVHGEGMDLTDLVNRDESVSAPVAGIDGVRVDPTGQMSDQTYSDSFGDGSPPSRP